MTKMANEELRFSFFVPDDFEELPQEKFAKYDVDPSTMYLFTKDFNNKPSAVPIYKVSNAHNEEEYLNSVNLTIEKL